MTKRKLNIGDRLERNLKGYKMKTYQLTEKQEAIVEQLNEAGFHARWWGRGSEAERIYLNGYRKDVKCWIEFDDPADLEGAALRVYVEDCGQHANWYKSQIAKARAHFADAFQIVTGQINSERAESAITESEAEALEVGSQVNWLVGGQSGDANDERTLNGTVISVTRKPSDKIGDDELVEVVIDRIDEFAKGECPLYTWRGVLRYGSGAEVVRKG
jgi:hypothetical protein